MSTRRHGYLHVEVPRTGTSYLQELFAQGLRLLPGDSDGFWVMRVVRGWLRPHNDPLLRPGMAHLRCSLRCRRG